MAFDKWNLISKWCYSSSHYWRCTSFNTTPTYKEVSLCLSGYHTISIPKAGLFQQFINHLLCFGLGLRGPKNDHLSLSVSSVHLKGRNHHMDGHFRELRSLSLGLWRTRLWSEHFSINRQKFKTRTYFNPCTAAFLKLTNCNSTTT